MMNKGILLVIGLIASLSAEAVESNNK